MLDARAIAFRVRHTIDSDAATRDLYPGTPVAGQAMLDGSTGSELYTLEQRVLVGADGTVTTIGRDQQA